MQPDFKTDYASIVAQIEALDPIAYGQSRNYIDGAVTYLSPYISRGVISTKQVLESVMKRGYKLYQIESFVKELCWRDYFQRVGQERNLSLPIKQAQTDVAHEQIPLAILQAKTGIQGIDQAIEQLYETGYMHNHARMYTASVVCNIAKSDWLMPARWMYYHLLDGDWASNACSWQWVAAANSGKKYYADQENINKYTKTSQRNTYLDCSYEELAIMEIPEVLKTIAPFEPERIMVNQQPKTTQPYQIDFAQPKHPDTIQPVFIYNYYNLDPVWHKDQPGQRILLLEPDFFQQYPISSKCWKFMMDLAAEIPNMQVYQGSFASLLQRFEQTNPTQENLVNNIRYKEHPLNVGYQGIEESRDWIAPSVQGYYPSFFAYWKAVNKVLNK
jgi:deoxyribodipyrimidine photo-lyase